MTSHVKRISLVPSAVVPLLIVPVLGTSSPFGIIAHSSSMETPASQSPGTDPQLAIRNVAVMSPASIFPPEWLVGRAKKVLTGWGDEALYRMSELGLFVVPICSRLRETPAVAHAGSEVPVLIRNVCQTAGVGYLSTAGNAVVSVHTSTRVGSPQLPVPLRFRGPDETY